MAYRVILSASAEKSLYALPRGVQMHLLHRLEKASSEPMYIVKRLKGVRYFSLRAGEYRAILDIDKHSGIIMVVDVGHRRDIYQSRNYGKEAHT